jgi:3'-phosphoadenosine 5'-phosphosulfate sulfotransferase (PAPS reductase)/FAD synthetase
MADLNPDRIPDLDARLSTLAPVDRLRWAYGTFGARAGIGTSFQPAGIVILHLA